MIEPFVSVIIPTCNRCKYVQEAVDSVLAQSFTNYELIVVDDGSTDKTAEAIKAKYNEKLKYFWQPNHGESKARNFGLALAKGEYLAFMDSDDKWHPDKLKILVEAIQKRRKKDPNIALACSSVWMINQDGKITGSRPAGRLRNLEKLKWEDFIERPRICAPPSNSLFVSDFVRDIGGFDEHIQYGEDWKLIIQLRMKYKFIYIDRPLTYYRVHSNQQRIPQYEKIETQFSDHIKVIQSIPISDKVIIENLIAYQYEKIAYQYFFYKDWQKGAEALSHANQISTKYLDDWQRVIQIAAQWGKKSAIFHEGKVIPKQITFFQEEFYPNLQKAWPNKLLYNLEIEKKIWSSFCHYLICDMDITKTTEEARFLWIQSFANNKNILLSLTATKEFLHGFLIGSLIRD